MIRFKKINSSPMDKDTEQANSTNFEWKKLITFLVLGLVLTLMASFVFTSISSIETDNLRTFFFTNIISFFISSVTVIFPISYLSKKYAFSRQYILLLLFILSVCFGLYYYGAIAIPIIFIISIFFYLIINFLLSKLPRITTTISLIFITLTLLASIWIIYDKFLNPRQEVFMSAMTSFSLPYSLSITFERGETQDEIIKILSSYGCTFEKNYVKNYLYCDLPRSTNENDLANLEKKIKTSLKVYYLNEVPVVSY